MIKELQEIIDDLDQEILVSSENTLGLEEISNRLEALRARLRLRIEELSRTIGAME